MGEGHHAGGIFDGRASTSLYGDNSAFAGMGIVKNNSASGRSAPTFCSVTAGGQAVWVLEDCLYTYDNKNLAGTIDASISGSTIAFGAIKGQAVLSAGGASMIGNVVELGSANTDFETWLSFTSTYAERPHNYATLKKVGSGTMTFGGGPTHPCWVTNVLAGGVWKMNNPRSLATPSNGTGGQVETTIVFDGGTVAFGEEFVDAEGTTLDISKNIRNSTKPVSVEVGEGQNVTWGTALAESNVGGLIKKGAGTLTLAATPANKYVRVEEGVLSLADDVRIFWDIRSTGSVSGGTITQYGLLPETTFVYSETPVSGGNHTTHLENLVGVDVSAFTGEVTKETKIVLATSTAFKGLTRRQLAALPIEWGAVEKPANVEFVVRVVDGQLVVADKAVGLAIIIK